MTSSRRSRALGWAAALLALFGCFSAWAIASPIGTNPDGDFHLANIYCTRDLPDCGRAWRGEVQAERLPACFPQIAGGEQCAQAAAERTPGLLWSHQSHYPELRFRVLAKLIGSTVGETELRVRIANAALGSVMIIASILLSGALWWRATAVMWVIFLVPYGMTLIPSTNPSGWLYLGVGSILGPLATQVAGPAASRLRELSRFLFTVLAALVALGSRSEAPLFLSAAAVLVVVLQPDRPALRRILLPIAILLTSVLVFLNRDWLVIPLGLRSSTFQLASVAVVGALAALVWRFGFRVPSRWAGLAAGLVAGGGLLIVVALRDRLNGGLVSRGYLSIDDILHNLLVLWKVPLSAVGLPLSSNALPAILDTALPLTAIAAMLCAVLLATAFGFSDMDWGRARALVVALGMALGFPLAVSVAKGLRIGDTSALVSFQPRYFAVGLLVVLFAFLTQREEGPYLPRFGVAAIAALATYANAAILATYLAYFVSIPGSGMWWGGVSAWEEPPWWWTPGLPPQTVLALGSLTFAAFAGLVVHSVALTRATVVEPVPSLWR